jgi:hypothetical protein
MDLYSARVKIQLLASQIADWIFSIRLTDDINIVRRAAVAKLLKT